MDFLITVAACFVLVAVLHFYLRRRGSTSASWDGREPGQQKMRDRGGGWIPK